MTEITPEMMQAIEAEIRRRGLESPTLMGKAASLVKRGASAVADAVTGGDRYDPEIPEYSTRFGDTGSTMGDLRQSAGLLLSTEDQQMVDVIQKNQPGTEVSKDEHGNTLIKRPGQTAWEYINKPGLSRRDVANMGAQAPLYVRGAQVAGQVAPGSLALRAPLVGGTSAVASTAHDFGAQAAAGQERELLLPKAGAAAAFGAGFEALAPLANALYRTVRSKLGPATLSPANARKVLAEAGLDLNELTDEALNNLLKMAKDAADPANAGAMAQAQGLPRPVPLTRGQITGSAEQQMLEDQMLKGSFGEGAESLMRGAQRKADTALRDNVKEIPQRMGGPGYERGEAGALTQQKLVDMKGTSKAAVDANYNAARALDGRVEHSIGGPLWADVNNVVKNFVKYEDHVMAKDLLAELGEIVGYGEGTPVHALYAWRAKVTEMIDGAKGPTQNILIKMKRQFDKSMQSAVDDALFKGDEKTVQAWVKAIKSRNQHGILYESDDLVGKLVRVDKDRRGTTGAAELVVAPEAASNAIFGVSNTNLLSKPELARELRKMRELLGPKSLEWNAVKEEAFKRLTERAAMAPSFSGAHLLTDFNRMTTKNNVVWETLFNKEERRLITMFVHVAKRATVPVEGGKNFSNTSSGVASLVRGLSKTLFMGEKGQAILSRVFPGVYEGMMLGPAYKATRGAVPLRQLPPGTVGGAGAAVKQQWGDYQ